ncbi:MAG: ribulose bisphosphate carboxylase small subunit [Rhodocyclaceae bacterium]
MRLTQGAFSFPPDLTDAQTAAHRASPAQRLGGGHQFTDDPHPRNTYWSMWGHPMFDLADAAGAMQALRECRQARLGHYIRINAFDPSAGWETVRLSFIVGRPAVEPGFRLVRREGPGRTLHYTLESYAVGRQPRASATHAT